MEKKIKLIPEKEYVVYESEDGEQFHTEELCILHELKIKQGKAFAKIPQVTTYDNYSYVGVWYFCKTQEEIETVIKQYDPNKRHSYQYTDVKPNEWFMVKEEDGDIWYFTLKEIKDDFYKFLDMLMKAEK